MKQLWRVVSLTAVGLLACSESAGRDPAGVDASGGAATSAVDPYASGETLRVPVAASARTYVKLAPLAVVSEGGDPPRSWDLAFQGYEIFSNGGASGTGSAKVFGPLETSTFAETQAPAVPFLVEDKPTGAFLEWYFYEGAPSHVLWSRYHVLGVKDGERLWKVQVLSYYGERDGAPIGGLYRLRWAELGANGVGPTREATNLDATAGGPQAPTDAASECLDLGSGERFLLTPAVAAVSKAWHLCFRRQNVSVNGGLSGPRGTTAVDLSAAASAGEVLAVVKARTEVTELAAFDAVTTATFATSAFEVDRVASGFGRDWLAAGTSPPSPEPGTWIVEDETASRTFFLGFPRFEGATKASPGTIVLSSKALQK